MDKKVIALGAAALLIAGAANAELKAFKVNGETVTVAEQKAIYDRAVQAGQPAGEGLERQVKNLLIQQTVLLQEANKAKIANKPDVKRAIENSRDQILIQGLAQDWAQKNPVSEADLKKAYDQDKAAYGDTEYQVRHILVKTEDQAKNLISRLNKGADFGKLAQEFSEDTGNKGQGGLLGWVVPRSFVPAFGASFTALKPGEIAQSPIRTQFGFHVVKLEAKRKAELYPSYESQKPVIRNALANQKVQMHFQDLIKKANVQ
ncbi:peptidylprolyl isomerase [uncultured Sutterella sp.]|uniref:peptidylprolyl isomerase n=1 Tax=uncultured Sutterella sp. TaxID=286133 RepID=UPI0025EF9474|nr:peptidylprolyl isomerase [uncultured Sutterella sp.]